MKSKDFGLSIKDVSEAGTFEGYGSTFGGSPDSYGDVVMPGAFTGSLVKHKREGSMPLMFFGHKSNELTIGSWLDMAEDGKGLWVRGQLDLDDPVGTRVHRKLHRKEMRGLSIGYEVKDFERDDKRPGVTMLKEVELWEVSVVNFPANRRSLVTDVKSILDDGKLPTVREFEEFLRDAGFSKTLATAIASKATPHLRGDPEAKAIEPAEFLRAMLASNG
jgi:HK97 family phage prohead protease